MPIVLSSPISSLLEKLKNEGKLTVLSDLEIKLIDQDINQEMMRLRQDLSRKQEQSNADTAKIILSA